MNATPARLRPATADDVDVVTTMLDITTRHWIARPTDADQTRERFFTPHTDIDRDTVVAEIDDAVWASVTSGRRRRGRSAASLAPTPTTADVMSVRHCNGT